MSRAKAATPPVYMLTRRSTYVSRDPANAANEVRGYAQEYALKFAAAHERGDADGAAFYFDLVERNLRVAGMWDEMARKAEELRQAEVRP